MGHHLPQPAPGARNPTAKNRVRGFFANPNKTRPGNRRQPQQPRRKNRPAPTKTASGIPLWPSRDPIGVKGGINLYGFVGNNGVNKWDILGLEFPAELKCCKVKRIIDNYHTVRDRVEYPHTPNGTYNHPTGRLWEGDMTVVCENGNTWSARVNTGGMRMRDSSIRGPSEENPLGDDSTAPSGDFNMDTERFGKKGFSVHVQGTGRGDVTKHLGYTGGNRNGSPYHGSHGCPTLVDPDEWDVFVELMKLQKVMYGKSTVKLRIQFPNEEPHGNRGNHKDDPPLVPIAIPMISH
jgi:hypothetical protein